MFILHDGEVILGKSFENNYTSAGTQTIDEIANDAWPDIDGSPARKNICMWDTSTGSVTILTSSGLAKRQAPALLAVTDTKMPRMLEDVIDTLISKESIIKSDLPQVVQDKYDEKKALRALLD